MPSLKSGHLREHGNAAHGARRVGDRRLYRVYRAALKIFPSLVDGGSVSKDREAELVRQALRKLEREEREGKPVLLPSLFAKH